MNLSFSVSICINFRNTIMTRWFACLVFWSLFSNLYHICILYVLCFSNLPVGFYIPIICSNWLPKSIRSIGTSSNKLKNNLFHKLFWLFTMKDWIVISKIYFFSHNRSEPFWKQNTIVVYVVNLETTLECHKRCTNMNMHVRIDIGIR